MSDMPQSEVRAIPLCTPVSLVARAVLACDSSVRSVMALDDCGKILAYESSTGSGDEPSAKGTERSYLFYSPGLRILLSLRLNKEILDEELQSKVEKTFNTPRPILIR